MSSGYLIMDLSANLALVQRRRMLRTAGLVLALAVRELALFLGWGLMRRGMGHMAVSSFLPCGSTPHGAGRDCVHRRDPLLLAHGASAQRIDARLCLGGPGHDRRHLRHADR